MVAARAGHVPVVEYLAEHGANKEAQDNDGKTTRNLADVCRQK